MRGNIDLVITMTQHQEKQREVLEDDFMADIPDEEIDNLLNGLVPPPGTPEEVCQNYKGLFVAMNNRENEKSGYDRVFYGKASMTPPGFIMGCAEWWGDQIRVVDERKRKLEEQQKKPVPKLAKKFKCN